MAIPADVRKKHLNTTQQLFETAQEVQELPEGDRFGYDLPEAMA